MSSKKVKSVSTIQSKGGKAVVKKYGKEHMKKLIQKRWKNAKNKE